MHDSSPHPLQVVTRDELFVTSKTDIYNPPARFANDTGYDRNPRRFEATCFSVPDGWCRTLFWTGCFRFRI